MSRQYPLVSHNYSPNCLLMIHSLPTMCIAEALAQGVQYMWRLSAAICQQIIAAKDRALAVSSACRAAEVVDGSSSHPVLMAGPRVQGRRPTHPSLRESSEIVLSVVRTQCLF
jgi:hypothetical protein